MKVSVLMITYNQEDYISDAIKGVFNQITNFEFEIVISNDASTDNSDFKIRELQKTNYNENLSIKYLHRDLNLGMILNYSETFKQCKGKYIATCEGDDYWVDPYKLQKQVDFMESNPDYVMCFTRYQRYFEDTEVFQISGHNESKTYNLKDFMHANHAATATVMFRSLNFDLKYLNNSPFGDWVLYNLILKYGDAYYMNDVTAVYRRHYFNSDFYNPMPYKKKLYILNRLFLRIHGVKYFPIFIKQVIKLFVFNKLY